MDFDELMARAAENVIASKKKLETERLKAIDTTVPAPKKEDRPKEISPHVLAFLAKQEEEKRNKCSRKKPNIIEMLLAECEKAKIDKEIALKRTDDKPALQKSHANSGAINRPQTNGKKNEARPQHTSSELRLAAQAKRNDSCKEKMATKRNYDEKPVLQKTGANPGSQTLNNRKETEIRLMQEPGKKRTNDGKPVLQKLDANSSADKRVQTLKNGKENAEQKQFSAKKSATKRTYEGKPVLQKTGANSGAINRPQTNGKENDIRPQHISSELRMAAQAKKNDYCKEKVANTRPVTAKEKKELDRQTALRNDYGSAAMERYLAQQIQKNQVKPTGKNDEQKQVDAKKSATKRTYEGKPVLQQTGANSGAINRPQTNGKENEIRPQHISSELRMAAQAKKNDYCKEKVAITTTRPMTAKEKKELEKQTAIRNDYGPAALEKYLAQQSQKNNQVEPIGKNDEQKQVSAKKTATKRTYDGKPVLQKSGANSADYRLPPTLKNGKEDEKRRPAEEKPVYSSVNETLLVCRPAPRNGIARPGAQTANIRDRFNVDASEDSDDDEDDDFIDDTALQNDPYSNNVSRHIRDIFGYDKRKFRDFDDKDDRSMETSYRDQMKEEAKSARLGKKEDLEDIRREKEELKRAQAKKMRR